MCLIFCNDPSLSNHVKCFVQWNLRIPDGPGTNTIVRFSQWFLTKKYCIRDRTNRLLLIGFRFCQCPMFSSCTVDEIDSCSSNVQWSSTLFSIVDQNTKNFLLGCLGKINTVLPENSGRSLDQPDRPVFSGFRFSQVRPISNIYLSTYLSFCTYPCTIHVRSYILH